MMNSLSQLVNVKNQMKGYFYGSNITVTDGIKSYDDYIRNLVTTNDYVPNGVKFTGSTFTRAGAKNTIDVIDMSEFYKDCANLTTVYSLPTSRCEDMSGMFYNCVLLTSISYMDTYNVKDMSSMFLNCEELTSIPYFNTSNVTDMNHMFYRCLKLGSLPELNTSNVTNMRRTFYQCYGLKTIPLLDTSNVTNMYGMFELCLYLESVPQLNTSRVTDMRRMFDACYSITTIPELDTSNVTDMNNMFAYCYALTSVPLLDVTNVVVVDGTRDMFAGCSELTNLGGFRGLKVELNLSECPKLTHESLMNVLNNLGTVSDVNLILGETNLAKLTDEEKSIATNKGWILS